MKRVCLIIVFVFLASTLQQKDPDEGRPYEFGFTIDGQQHRHEKKDIRGIIEGEFGFITADGIYHVTVYATDENGNFKIISMKNIRISAPLDGSPFKGEISPEANKYRKQANLPPLPSPQASPNPLAIPEASTQLPLATSSKQPFKFTTQSTIKPACAGCGYVTTQKPQPDQPLLQFTKPPFFQGQNVKPQQPFGIQNGQSSPTYYENTAGVSGTPPNAENYYEGSQQPVPSEPYGGTHEGVLPQNVQDSQNYIGGPQGSPPQQRPQISSGTPPQYQATSGPQNTNYKPFGGFQGGQPTSVSGGGQGTQGTQNYGGAIEAGVVGIAPQGGGVASGDKPIIQPGHGGQTNIGGGISQPTSPQGVGGLEQGNVPTFEQLGFPQPNPLQVNGKPPGSQVSSLPPISVSNGVIHVGGDKKQDIHIKDKFPGMQEGLPDGIEEKDITNLLYKFHYTVGFHGHYEKGLKNGAKVGGYFVNGRDGISRVVTYVADENGYRPKVRFINIGLDSEDTPKPETEKKFGLKSFEFVWYPI